MRILDPNTGETLGRIQLYLSPSEARKLVGELQGLLRDVEAKEHFHLFSEDGSDEVSVSVVTEAKLAAPGYAAEERRAFGVWKPHR